MSQQQVFGPSGGGSFGDVTGPSSAVSGNLASFNGTTGKIIQDSGVASSDVLTKSGNLAGLSNTTTSRTNLGLGTSATLNAATNTFTPNLTFGGGSTGITYSQRNGEYFQIGNIVFFSIFMILSNKGSSTGAATLSLPVNSGGVLSPVSFGYWGSVTLGANYTDVGGYVQSNVVNISQNGSAQTTAVLTDTAFANNSILGISGFYFTS